MLHWPSYYIITRSPESHGNFGVTVTVTITSVTIVFCQLSTVHCLIYMVYCLLCLVSIFNYVLQVLWHMSMQLNIFFNSLRYWCTQISNTLTPLLGCEGKVFFFHFWAIFGVLATLGIHNLSRSLHPPLFQGVLSHEHDTAADVPSFSLNVSNKK